MSLVSVVKNAVVKGRHNIIYWWGNCSYSQLRVTYEVRAMLCPHCGSELVDGEYSGSKVFAKDRKALDYVRDSWLPLLENGLPVWHVVAGNGGRKPYKES
jgi:NMD protein affecting ribosome stability and mRNA decay